MLLLAVTTSPHTLKGVAVQLLTVSGGAAGNSKAARLGAHPDQESANRLIVQGSIGGRPVHSKATDAWRVSLLPLFFTLS